MTRPRRFSARTVLGGLVAASVVGAGVAVAAEHAGSSPTVSLTTAAATASPSASPRSHPHQGPRFGGFGGAGLGAVGPGQLIGLLVKDTGQTPMQIMQAISSGQTLDQIAGGNAGKVRSDALAALKTGLDAAVTKGVITAAQETSLLKDAGDAIDVLMSANLGKLGLGAGAGHAGGFPFGGGHHGQRPDASPAPSPAA